MPPTDTYRQALARMLATHEGIRPGVYLDAHGLPTIGLGLLLVDAQGAVQHDAVAGVRGVMTPDRAQLWDRLVQALASAGNAPALLAQDFVIEPVGGVPTLVRFRDGDASNDRSAWRDIRSLLPAGAPMLEAAGPLLRDKERVADGVIASVARERPGFALDDTQRAALVCRIYNGFDPHSAREPLVRALVADDPLEAFRALTASRSAPGHIRRSLEEFRDLMPAGRVQSLPSTRGEVGYRFTDRQGRDTVVGYDRDPGGRPRAVFAYRLASGEQGGPPRRVYFDPRSPNAISQRMPLRMADVPAVRPPVARPRTADGRLAASAPKQPARAPSLSL